MRAGRAVLLVAAGLAAGAGCALRPLPAPGLEPCPGATPEAFWRCVLGAPVPDGPGRPIASTVRAADLARKRIDQEAPGACGGPVPAGFTRLAAIPMAAGRAPLHALFAPPAPGFPIVVVVHGLFDSKHTGYVTVTAGLLRREGFGVLAPDMRWHGCLLSQAWLPGLGREEAADLAAWAGWLRDRHPGHPIGLVGFSLGGLDVLHVLARPDLATRFEAGAVAISPAAALGATTAWLDTPGGLLDQGARAFVLGAFRDWIRIRTRALGVPVDSPGPFRALLEWLAREGPFPAGTTVEALIRESEPVAGLARARRPVLVVASRSDPVIPPVAIATLEAAAAGNPWARVVVTPGGGHVGQLARYPGWMARVLVAFFRASAGVRAGS